jgi:hypothetical protein
VGVSRVGLSADSAFEEVGDSSSVSVLFGECVGSASGLPRSWSCLALAVQSFSIRVVVIFGSLLGDKNLWRATTGLLIDDFDVVYSCELFACPIVIDTVLASTTTGLDFVFVVPVTAITAWV